MTDTISPWVISLLAALGSPIQKTDTQNKDLFSIAGHPIVLSSAYVITSDCGSGALPLFMALKPPRNGELTVEAPSTIRSSASSKKHDKCDGHFVKGTSVSYTPNKNAQGKDSFTYLIVYETGEARRYRVNMMIFANRAEQKDP